MGAKSRAEQTDVSWTRERFTELLQVRLTKSQMEKFRKFAADAGLSEPDAARLAIGNLVTGEKKKARRG